MTTIPRVLPNRSGQPARVIVSEESPAADGHGCQEDVATY